VAKPITNVAGFDDAPFAHEHRGQVRIVGAVCARTRLDGVVSGFVRRDGSNATRRIEELVRGTRFADNVRAVLLQGIAVAGFNVIDIVALHESLRVPVIVVMRRPPRLDAVKRALLDWTPGGARKWALVERAGPIERLGRVYTQRVGIDRDAALALLDATTLHGNVPEPLRIAHLIAGGLGSGESRGRA
jgi:uncharacterized protein